MSLRRTSILALLLFLGGTLAAGQTFARVDDSQRQELMPDFTIHKPLPTLAPEIALQAFLQHTTEQRTKLAGYQDETTVTAELPDTQQKGEYQLQRVYTAQPRSLSFTNAHFTGDGFVKTNVLTRLLQSEVDHVEKDDQANTAVNFKNYKFNFRGVETDGGQQLFIFQVKPRHKTPGLFKGTIFLDAQSASLRRMEGTLVKSPSFFIKDLEFVQDFEDVDGFTFPTTLHSKAKTRIVGRVLVNVIHRAYKVNHATTTTGSDTVAATQTVQ